MVLTLGINFKMAKIKGIPIGLKNFVGSKVPFSNKYLWI
jgi:hypothetical protein